MPSTPHLVRGGRVLGRSVFTEHCGSCSPAKEPREKNGHLRHSQSTPTAYLNRNTSDFGENILVFGQKSKTFRILDIWFFLTKLKFSSESRHILYALAGVGELLGEGSQKPSAIAEVKKAESGTRWLWCHPCPNRLYNFLSGRSSPCADWLFAPTSSNLSFRLFISAWLHLPSITLILPPPFNVPSTFLICLFS